MPALFHFAAAFFASAASSTAAPMKPLHLHVEQQGKMMIFRVVGLADAASSVSYDLQVTDGRNRSNQRGIAHLEAGIQSTIATVRVISAPDLSAELNVKTATDTTYVEKFAGSRGP